ncbi:tyrosine-type recombinase/integrase [Micromonospora matsumotoense]|uniref:tyrosine-type recombinase/integrase n=1 Tax=Micromonospora matsumotoense TaxID=121616 RepID=UPI0033E58327
MDTTPALTRDQVAALWRLDVGLRDKTLWRLLYETVARAEETLTLDVSDLGLASKRARVVSKGGRIEWVFWQTGAAMLLPRLLAGRTHGPVFSPTASRPAPWPPSTCAPSPAGPGFLTAVPPRSSSTRPALSLIRSTGRRASRCTSSAT